MQLSVGSLGPLEALELRSIHEFAQKRNVFGPCRGLLAARAVVRSHQLLVELHATQGLPRLRRLARRVRPFIRRHLVQIVLEMAAHKVLFVDHCLAHGLPRAALKADERPLVLGRRDDPRLQGLEIGRHRRRQKRLQVLRQALPRMSLRSLHVSHLE